MTSNATWLAAAVTVVILVGYELALTIAQRRHPERLARTAHAALREEWFAAVSAHAGSELLAVQTLRNSLMSATMVASSAALGLMGTATLAVPALHASIDAAADWPTFTARLALELLLLAVLLASLVSSVTAVRYYNHASFICAMPVGSATRERWRAAGSAYVRRAGVLYSWGLKQLILVVPILASILYPAAGPVAAVLVVAALQGFDRFSPQDALG
nr:DUF599 domain-containing protein [uncultured Albidiferax sp.]